MDGPPRRAVILHADMDAFYAAVEQHDDPTLRGRPVLVGPPSGRGVVLTASYEARPWGVGSAMPMARARQRCPQALVVPPRFERYVEVSGQIMDVFDAFSPVVEPLSLDEAFLDMTGSEGLFGSPERMGWLIKRAVREATGLAVSVGASATKYVAKVASDVGKPDGLLVVPGEDAVAFLAPLPVSRLWGSGPTTSARLNALGLLTIADVAAADGAWLRAELGPSGAHFQALARAEDPRPVRRRRRAGSVGCQRTLPRDARDLATLALYLRRSADEIGRRLRRKALVARGLRVKLKTARFRLLTRQAPLPAPTNVSQALYEASLALLERFDRREPFRLVGMTAYDLEPERPQQLDLFAGWGRRERLERALDSVRDRFGDAALRRAEDLAHPRGWRLAPNLDGLTEGGDQPHQGAAAPPRGRDRPKRP